MVQQAMRIVLILTLHLLLPVRALALSFHDVSQKSTRAMDSAPADVLAQIRIEATGYAKYRQAPQSSQGQDYALACVQDERPSVFCVLLNSEPSPSPTETPRAIRQKFVSAIRSLDDPKARTKQCPAAEKDLISISQDDSATSLKTRALYWLWSCAHESGNVKAAAAVKDMLWQLDPFDFHMQKVLEVDLDDRLSKALARHDDLEVQLTSTIKPELNPLVLGVEVLHDLHEDGAAAVLAKYLSHASREAEPAFRLYLAVLSARVGAAIPSVLPVTEALGALLSEHPELITFETARLLFPTDYNMPEPFFDLIRAHAHGADPYLLAGLVHQESGLNPRAASDAGAFGLTQMLIGTATDQLKLWSQDPKSQATREMLFEPKTSLDLGALDLVRRLKVFSGDELLTLASYNAGESAVKNWVKTYPKWHDPQAEIDLLFMDRASEFHVAEYVAQILAKRSLYRQLDTQ